MKHHLDNSGSARALQDATCRMALAGLLHDLGKFTERAKMPVRDQETLEINKQIYCPHRKRYPNDQGWFTHVHAAYTALALDAIETKLPPIKGEQGDATPFDGWGAAGVGGGDNSLVNAAAKHHKPDTFLQWIVATADRAASGLDREQFDKYNQSRDEDPTSGKNHYTIRQYTLFEQIDIESEAAEEDHRSKPEWKHRYRLEPLSPQSIFPALAENCEVNDRVAARAEYAALWKKFQEALTLVPESHRRNWSLWLDHFKTLWMTFTHAIPAATAFGTIPDVSLYDHSCAVAALAAALWRYHHEHEDDPNEVRDRMKDREDWDEEKLLFIQGDLFGIQDFIFASGGATTKRAAKLLRGRSFFVTLLTECAALRVLNSLSLPPTSQIINAAGKFQIIAPNTDSTIKKLQELRKDLDKWFLLHTFGQSGIGLAWTPASCKDLQQGSRKNSPYRCLVKRLFEALDIAKLQRFSLCGESAPYPVFDNYLENIGEHGLCSVDGRSPADGEKVDGDDSLSRLSCDQIRVGNLLTKEDRDRLLVTKAPMSGGNIDSLDIDIFGFHVGITSAEEASGRFGHDAAAGNLLRVWDFALPDSGGEPQFHGYARRNVNAWAPRFEEEDLAEGPPREGTMSNKPESHQLGDIKPFDTLARAASGVSALMTLKGDVDNLGAIFQRGLQAPSLSRVAALSRQMNAFFTVYLPHLCRTEFRNTYTVFAGGDDFFLIGPWTQQMKLAARLRDEFHKYVTGNAQISFSAGLAMTKPGLPVRQIKAMAEKSLEQSKGHSPENTRPKDALTCFGQTVNWPQFEQLLAAQARFTELTSKLKLSRGYIYGLLELADMRENLRQRPDNALWRSRFHYRTWRMLERNPNLDHSKRKAFFEELATEIVREGIEKFRGDYRLVLFSHLYQSRTKETSQ